MNTRYYVEIGQPVSRVIEVRSLADALALLWRSPGVASREDGACARHRPFLPALCEWDEGELLINEGLRGRPLPGPGQYAHFREGVGYWEAALELDDPESQLGSAVIAALNCYQTVMMDNPLAGEPERFSSIVAETARDWAGECQGTTSYEVVPFRSDRRGTHLQADCQPGIGDHLRRPDRCRQPARGPPPSSRRSSGWRA